jgi:GxxExxY protein
MQLEEPYINSYSDKDYPYQKESYQIIGICMEVHRLLGKGFLEIVYKDALEYEFKQKNILFEREKKYNINYKEIVLPHNFYADFIVMDKIIIEIKGSSTLISEHRAQVINYLAASKLKLGLLINFGESSLKVERIIL